MSETTTTIYEAIGGESAIRRIVCEFYSRVAEHPLLRPLFPDSFDEVAKRQYWFLSQLFGGPKLYMEYRGQPMLRMRHLRFSITENHAHAWLSCMREALQAADIYGPAADAMYQRLHMTALHMINAENTEKDENAGNAKSARRAENAENAETANHRVHVDKVGNAKDSENNERYDL